MNNKKKYFIFIGSIFIALIGVSFAFFNYYKQGLNRELIAGDIYLNMDETGGFVTLTNVFPETKEEARARDDNTVTFTIDGRNSTTNKTIYYEIMLDEGDTNTSYTNKIKPEHLRFDLIEIINGEETMVVDAGSYSELNRTRIWVNKVEPNTTEITRNYQLRVWLSEDVLISDTDPEADYPANTWKEHYASVKVSVYGDFEEKKMPIYLNKTIESTLTLTEADTDGTRFVTGTVPNNYVWYSGKLWRIVGLNEDDTVKLVTQGNMTAIAWDSTSTNTDYSTSQIRNWLNNEFLPTINQDLIVESTWDYTTYESFPTTRLTPTNTVTDKVGLLTIYDYAMTGGTDDDSTASTFLNNGYLWWTMSPKTDGSSVWYVISGGDAYYNSPTDSIGARPSVNLVSGIQLVDNGATGTKENPYMLKGDYETGKTNDSLNTRISGEYIKFNNVLYRIVGTEEVNGNLLTKVTMADYSINQNTLSKSVKFGANTNEITFSPTYGIGLYLENWYQADSTNTTYASTYISDTYKRMIATKDEGVVWYAGPDSGGAEYDYTLAKTGTSISATIGLGRYGEMFSSQYGDGSGPSTSTWLMTKYNSSRVWNVNIDGYANNYSPTFSYGARPSFYLKSDVKIGDVDGDGNSGNGQQNSPYEIVQ